MSWLEKVKTLKGLSESLELSEVLGAGSSALPLHEFLNLVLEILAKENHVLVGGLALAEYAKPRATQDLDFVIATDDMDKLVKHFEDHGFKMSEHLPYMSPKREIIKLTYKGRECDLLFFKNQGFTSSLVKRAKTTSLFGKRVKIASAEDLVITKLASMRWKDKADIMAIRSKSDTLDLGYIRERLWDLGISDRVEFLKLPVED